MGVARRLFGARRIRFAPNEPDRAGWPGTGGWDPADAGATPPVARDVDRSTLRPPPLGVERTRVAAPPLGSDATTRP